jgi:NADH-quinone oxidoreductase subunit J
MFYISAAVAVASTALVITRKNPVHALLYLIVSLLAVAVDFFLLGAPFVAALEVIVYAGAIMVLFVFVIMMLNLGAHTAEQEGRWLSGNIGVGPAILAAVLLGEIIYVFIESAGASAGGLSVPPEKVGQSLYGPYLVGVELASLLLLAGLVGAYHLGRRPPGDEAEGQSQ